MALSVDFFESLNDSYPIDLSLFTNMCSSSTPEPTSSLKNITPTLPTDLRIGSKVRVTSNHPFPWLKSATATGIHKIIIPPNEISMGMCLSMNGYAENAQIASIMSMARTPLAILHASSTFYRSAGLSTKPLFPRLEGTFSNKKSSKVANETSLLSEWPESFTHLYRTWLTGDRQYFYACAYSFTALFVRAFESSDATYSVADGKVDGRGSPDASSSLADFDAVLRKDGLLLEGATASSGSEQPPHRIVITPTSLGFRELLTAEGIKFTLPLRNSNKSFIDYALEKGDKDFLPSASKRDENHQVDDGADDLDEDEWLKDIGISPKSTIKFRKTHSFVDFSATNFEDLEMDEVKPLSASVADPNVNPMKFANGSRKRKAARLTSNQPPSAVQEDVSRSTVVITDPDSMDAFHRLLLSHKVGVSKNGLHAGLPPTLIAASPFLNAVSRRLKISSQVTKKSNELKYVLELDDGPIMPFVTKLLVEFLTASFLEDKMANEDLKKPTKKGSTAHIQILGQLPYAGLNEAMKTSAAVNINEFHIDFTSQSFSF